MTFGKGKNESLSEDQIKYVRKLAVLTLLLVK